MWYFSKLPEGEPERDPRESEFFNVGDLDPSASLVREIIQNSLDAKHKGNECVNVKFTFGCHPFSNNSKYYENLVPHLVSSGILPQGFVLEGTIPFLLIEDFGTTGLDGHINRGEIKVGEKSNYYDFWWQEGKSSKGGQDAGRWGLGKTVFFSASHLRSFWGLTIRQDDQQILLLGKSVMKTHRHTDGETYKYFSYFTQDTSKPIKEKGVIDDFCNAFSLNRKNEPGLSIVIPYPVEITPEAIIRSVIIHYFFPIMKKMLVVEVNNNSSKVTIDNSTLRTISLKQNWEDTAWQNRDVDSLMKFLENVAQMPDGNMISLEMPKGTPRMDEKLLGNNLDKAKESFSANALLGIHVPITIQKTGEAPIGSHFEVYIQKDESLKQADEFYIRSGITISEIKVLGNRRTRALLFARDKVVSTFLGDSESPAHTDWKPRAEELKKYTLSQSTLSYIKYCMRDIVKILDQPSPGLNPDFLQDIFFLSDETKPGAGGNKPIPPIPPPPPQNFNISKIQGGCKITLSDKKPALPFQAIARFAYDVLRGSPFSNYHPLDFTLNHAPIKVSISHGHIITNNENQITFEVLTKDFELKVTGFDEHRDIVVDVR